MVWYALLRLCYAVRSVGDHAEVSPTSGHLAPIAYHIPRVYAVTGKSRWVASCLYFMTFVQAAFGIANVVYDASRPGTISRLAL